MARKETRRLTDLELEIMRVVWDRGAGPLTVRDAFEELERRGRPLAYTSVQTMMTILRRKGALKVRRGSTRAHEFVAGISRAEATGSMTREFVTRLFGGKAEPLFAQLLDHESVDRRTLEEWKRAIEVELEEEDR